MREDKLSQAKRNSVHNIDREEYGKYSPNKTRKLRFFQDNFILRRINK